MSALNAPPADIESTAVNPASDAGAAVGSTSFRRHRRRRRRRRPRPSAAASIETTTDGSFRFSDTEDENRSLHSQRLGSAAGGSYEECGFSTESDGISVISGSKRHGSRRGSCRFSDEEEEGKEEMVDLESGELELKVHNRVKKRECRICHLKVSAAGNSGGGSGDQTFIELGCSCKGDLGSAHKQCAETWFIKTKGNTTCEICGASAVNIAGEQTIEVNAGSGLATAASTPVVFPETRSYCHGRRVMNFLLACMVFAFIISWLFHFKILP